MYLLLNLSYCVKRYGHFRQILACLTIPTHQIRSCDVTQVTNGEVGLILHLILRAVTKFLVEKFSTSEVISQKPQGRGKHPLPPSAFRVNMHNFSTTIELEFVAYSNIFLFL